MTALSEAVALREQGRLEEARTALRSLIDMEPDNPEVWYHYAWVHDMMELEREAVPYYEKALRLGLAGEARQGAMLGLGSTLRTLGRYEQAREVLEAAIEAYPDRRGFQAFYAMVLYNLKEHAASMQILLHLVAETSGDEGILAYRKAIGFYADKLDRIWET
ncbi:tetratricopeptide repeat protein [Paenibacillus sacheonensis]|uniref:Tetratricopeptide repeat protein n=1 Tax=Paenibacillus sacheonensis TaxID=742054 RepID=A0A7X5C0H8_9BACL|nr:tetratricopeptide repeat protein [Paenibacillus sacheonensis]MBM7564729.1 tetratricopeptide (TPR) repeat protein [Paenibacillus sacheonensis]NBC69285.1 tetratricopeptide repeat protein [Paenibacillus sacheonensis]